MALVVLLIHSCKYADGKTFDFTTVRACFVGWAFVRCANVHNILVCFQIDKRGHCFNEIVETESNYVSHLEMMIQQFIGPLRGVLNGQDIRDIFMNTEVAIFLKSFLPT